MNDIIKKRGLLKTWLLIFFPKLHCRIDGHLLHPENMLCGRCRKKIDLKKDKIDRD